jgi:hypothetical protein
MENTTIAPEVVVAPQQETTNTDQHQNQDTLNLTIVSPEVVSAIKDAIELDNNNIPAPITFNVGFRKRTKNINESIGFHTVNNKKTIEVTNCLICNRPIKRICRKGFCSTCYTNKVNRMYHIEEALTRVLKRHGLSNDVIKKEIMEEKKRFFPNIPEEILNLI